MSETTFRDWREKSTFYYHARPLRRALVWLLRHTLAPLLHMQVEGLQYVSPRGPIILASNHVSTFDGLAMQLALPRPIFFMGKAELFKLAPVGGVFRELGVFPVQRGARDRWALRHACRVLEAGQVLGMFPEGTRSKGRGLGSARTGVARLALETDCAILPMALLGTDRFLGSIPRRMLVQVFFLPPIIPGADETPLALTDRLMFAIAAALPASLRGAYSCIPS